MKILASIAFAALLTGCVTESERKDKPAWSRLSSTPFQKRRALYARMEAEGSITHEQREALTKQWQAQKPLWENELKAKERRAAAVKKARKEHERWVESLAPAQRQEIKTRERQREQQARAAQSDAPPVSPAPAPEGQTAPPQRQERPTAVYLSPSDSDAPPRAEPAAGDNY